MVGTPDWKATSKTFRFNLLCQPHLFGAFKVEVPKPRG